MLDRLSRLVRLPTVSAGYANYVRYLAMRLLVAPAATGSGKLAFRLADGIGRLLVLTTSEGRWLRRELAFAFGLDSDAAMRAASARLALPLRDFAYLRRAMAGLERIEALETGSSAARDLVRRPGPLVITSGHFARRAALPLYLPAYTPGPVGMISLPIAPWSLRPYALRIRLQFGTWLSAISRLRNDRNCYVYTGSVLGTGGDLLRRLMYDRHKVNVAADAPWQRNLPTTHVRPFAGRREAVFSVGPARVARMAQVPIVLCLPYLDNDGRTVLEWQEPIEPPPRNALARDREITDQLLDRIEAAVGARPTQYVLQIGGQRRWQPERGGWQECEPRMPAVDS